MSFDKDFDRKPVIASLNTSWDEEGGQFEILHNVKCQYLSKSLSFITILKCRTIRLVGRVASTGKHDTLAEFWFKYSWETAVCRTKEVAKLH